ncbi:MAG: hypothetical protein JSV17_15555 [Candidatus Aminicenantes bacterium]|nr:MAG: hypothetical protein JSV17_15555 [Candidatus Aminicenantes bacterium]
MKVSEVLRLVRQVRIPQKGYPVEETVAKELLGLCDNRADVVKVGDSGFVSEEGALYIAVIPKGLRTRLDHQGMAFSSQDDWVSLNSDVNQCLWLLSSKPYFLYTGFTQLIENFLDEDITAVLPWMHQMGFSIEKSTFDLFLTQYARMIRDFDREKYIREYARLGFTHIEVNSLDSSFPLEKGVPGEFYPDFYTYCPALDQFVSSRLNEGIYPAEYLENNLKLLKDNARLALKYGLVPGLLCFEPRSVPETLLEKYPTLRGARVDHPFRSFKPRYNLSIAHPVVQKHYQELLIKLMKEVPELGFMTIWSNDSGAGFEHTKSLYVGRNGGAYLIREWKDDEAIARSAASNIIRFYRLLRDAGSRINPEFRIVTRLESFYGERDHLWAKLGERLDVEVNSLLVKGWESIYPHPQYSDVKILGSAYHNTLINKERGVMEELDSRNSRSYFYHALGCHTNHEPLLGIPFPWLTHEKLLACVKLGIRNLAHVGGIHPPDKVPYAVNQEIFRLFQLNPSLDIEEAIRKIALRYAGRKYGKDLIESWRFVEQAIRAFIPLSIYSHYGVVWQRLFVRPLVPDIDKIPRPERTYYESQMCTSIHNPNRIDLSKDVLFELVTKDYAHMAFSRIDENVWAPLGSAIGHLKEKRDEAAGTGEQKAATVFEDQYFRARALKCLYTTLRNTAVWIYAVHEYLDSNDSHVKADCRELLKKMIDREIQNCRELIELWNESPIEWMIVSGAEETPFIHAENFSQLLEKKIALMENHRKDEPRVDPDYMFHLENNPYYPG